MKTRTLLGILMCLCDQTLLHAQETTPTGAATRMEAFLQQPRILVPRGGPRESHSVVTMDYEAGKKLLEEPITRLKSRDISPVIRTTAITPTPSPSPGGPAPGDPTSFGVAIQFQINSHELTGNSNEILDAMAAKIKAGQVKWKPIAITGHTDQATGSPDWNGKLSWARAQRVHQYFHEKHGLEIELFKPYGYGGLKPKFPEDSPEHIVQNRRVEFHQPEASELVVSK